MELSHTEIAPISSACLAPPRRMAEAPGGSFPAGSHVLTGLQLPWPVYAHRTWSLMGLGPSTAPAAGCPRAGHRACPSAQWVSHTHLTGCCENGVRC